MVITGAMSFLQPFNKTTTNVHVFFAVLMVAAMVWHVVERSKGFRRHLGEGVGERRKARWLAIPAVVLGVVLVSMDFGIGNVIASLSYEGREADAIFRSRPDIAYQAVGGNVDVLKTGDDLTVSLEVDLETEGNTFVVIWAENDHGDIIETLFLSDDLRYQEGVSHGDLKLTRTNLLPIWSHRWQRLKDGVEDEELDGVSSATITRSFSLNSVLKDGVRGFHLMMEVNRLDDDNNMFSATTEDELSQTLPGLGQPSVLYKAFVDFHEEHFDSYFLLQYEGHGALQGEDGIITRSSEGLTSARRLVQKALLHVDYQVED
jgi:hypothetical protein